MDASSEKVKITGSNNDICSRTDALGVDVGA